MANHETRFKISLRQFLVDSTLRDFDEYSNYFEEHISKLQANFEEEIKNVEKEERNDEEEAHFQAYADAEYEKYGQFFPQLLRSSLFLAMFSFCENWSSGKICKLSDDDEITILRYIRHLIAHNDSKLGDDARSRKVKEYISKRTDISLDNLGRIEIDCNYCKHVKKVFQEYYNKYFKEISNNK